MSAPDVSKLTPVHIPRRLYTIRENMLSVQLLGLYNRYMNGELVKSQVNLTGHRCINTMGEKLRDDVKRWLSKSRRGLITPRIWTDIDKWTEEKIHEWESIVDDM